MKTKRYMPANLAGLALIAVLWQAEVQAQTAKREEQRRDVRAPAGGHRKGGRRVVIRQHSAFRPRARGCCGRSLISRLALGPIRYRQRARGG